MENAPHFPIHIHDDPFIGDMDRILQRRLDDLLEAIENRDRRAVKQAAAAIDSHTINLQWHLDNE